jgi:hypothetical protein
MTRKDLLYLGYHLLAYAVLAKLLNHFALFLIQSVNIYFLIFLDTNDWKNYYKLKAKELDNNCHTIRKKEGGECGQNRKKLSDSDYESLKTLEQKTYYGHRYMSSNVDKCIALVLSSPALTFSGAILLVFFALLI